MATKTIEDTYRKIYTDVQGELTVIQNIVEQDFPNPAKSMIPTRYHVDAMRDLLARLKALVDGYEAKG